MSINSAPPVRADKPPAHSPKASDQGGFGRALKDVHSQENAPSDGGKEDGPIGKSHAGKESTSWESKSSAKDREDIPLDEAAPDTLSGIEAAPQSVLAINSTGLSISFEKAMGNLDSEAEGAEFALMKVKADKFGPSGIAAGITGELPVGAKSSAQVLADLAAGTVPGAALQANMGAAGQKTDSRNPLHPNSDTNSAKNNKVLSGMADSMKEVANLGSTKELPGSDLATMKTAAVGEENMLRASVSADANKDAESLMLGAKAGVDSAAVKPVNDLAMASMSQSSQTLINAVKENSNWTKMLSAPTVHFSETIKPNGKMLQALSVTLNPVELGRLELNLRMHQGQVTIDVRTESDQAYRSLVVDQEALVNNLRSMGFKVDGITINGPQSENTTQFQNNGQAENQNAGDGLGGEASRGQQSSADDPISGANEGANVDEEDHISLNVI
ncbi:MAG: flagellar hook-length control protein FliK [Rhizobiaceae bacterium]